MKNEELLLIVGGVSISGTILNAIARVANIVLEIGRSLGTSIRRKIDGNVCSI